MCGICGAIGIETRPDSESIVGRMMAAIRHRGPDEEGVLIAPPVALGIRRLSIIDLPGGHQPVWNEAGTLAIVFNGEIYNFPELRRELESQGHQFRTRSDTEVIVHAYESWGAECVRRLRGMFAFAIVEMPGGPSGAPQRVFLARDRLGIKPLYYAIADGKFLFASEVRALLASGQLSTRISREALESYLTFGSASEPMTLVEGITSLPPGHFLFVPTQGNWERVASAPYWSLSTVLGEAVEPPKTTVEAATSLRGRLEDSVRKHLLADVPLGVFLSSGLDSTALAALANRECRGIHTFTVAFSEEDYNEAELARRTAERLGTHHQELLLTGEEMRARLDEAVSALDQPSMDGINTFFVSWAARQAGLKVALSGLGSDELFGGYTTFRSAPRVENLAAAGKWVPGPLRAASAAALEAAAGLRSAPDAARKLGAAWKSPEALPHPYFFTRALFTPEQVTELLHDTKSSTAEPAWRAWLAQAAEDAARLDRFTAVSWLELRSYLVNTLLRDTDAMSMSQSLEVRVPFLDHPLVEFVLRLPEALKQSGARPKALLIEALRDILPKEIVTQQKRTFTFPWQNWLRGPLREHVQEGLANLSPALQPYLRAGRVHEVWKDFLDGRTSWSRPWSLYVLNEWSRRHADAREIRGAAAHSAATPSVA
jgi:asparagine synthase (glutamine-hydrolysing)